VKKYDVRSCTILRKEKLTQDVYDFTVEAGPLADAAQPGQFAQIAVPGKTLRRPISVCEIDRARHTLRFVFQVRGEGTRILAGFEPGEALDILAPLGKGYDLGDTNRRVIFVGRGHRAAAFACGGAAFREKCHSRGRLSHEKRGDPERRF
jgi:dihydroorotate dehydrogenase electron transfer subunit